MNNTEDEAIEIVVEKEWVTSLKKKVLDSKFRDEKGKPTIYRVLDILKTVDLQAYEPILVSLGPYHRDKSHVQAMNQLKCKYLGFVLEQNSGMALEDYLDWIKRQEKRARDAYSEEVKMSSNNFAEMMLLDGCYVMLTILEWNIITKTISGTQEWRRSVERNFKTRISEESTLLTRRAVVRDIFILENQLPFFLLETLYDSAFPGGPPFRNQTFQFIRMHTSFDLKPPSDDETFQHIIHLFLSCIDPTRNYGDGNLLTELSLFPTFGFLRRLFLCPWYCYRYWRFIREAMPEDEIQIFEFPSIPTAKVLHDAGIHLERKKKAKSFLDITFHNGKLQIPKLQIDDNTNSLLRNLIAYEQFSMGPKFHVSSYAKLMDYIIKTAEDVELLQKDEIIINNLGDSQAVATLFHKLPINIDVPWSDAYFFLCHQCHAEATRH